MDTGLGLSNNALAGMLVYVRFTPIQIQASMSSLMAQNIGLNASDAALAEILWTL